MNQNGIANNHDSLIYNLKGTPMAYQKNYRKEVTFMDLETSEKKLTVDINDEITIRKVLNPITGKATFLVNNYPYHQAFTTDDIIIAGVQLTC